jgi:tight adherence protein B
MSDLLAPLAYVLAFIAVVVLAQTVAGLVFASRDRNRRVNRRLTMLEAGHTPEQVYASLVRRARAPTIGGPRLLRWYNRAEAYLRQAGISQSPFQVLAIAGGIAGLLWLLALSLARSGTAAGFLLNSFISLLAAVALAACGVGFWVHQARRKRVKAIERQLPTALDIIVRAIRAGHPVITAVRLASDEMGDPIGSEFGLIVDETSYGVEFGEALANFARRTGSSDAYFFAVSVSIQSETGGNLAEILEGLSTVIRGRHTLSQRVKALSSEGRATALLLSALPVVMIAFQVMIHPRIYSDKFSDPIFWPAVTVTFLNYLLGWAITQRITNFKY